MDKTILTILLGIVGLFFVVLLLGILLAFPFTALVKRHPKLYTLLNLTITIYPYLFTIILSGMTFLNVQNSIFFRLIENMEFQNKEAVSGFIPILVCLAIQPIIWASLSMDFRLLNSANTKTVSTLSVVNKIVHIPAYIFIFILGAVGFLSLWGAAFGLIAIIIDLIYITFSGTFSLAANLTLYKQKKISLPVAIFASIASYIYCIDIIAVIVVKIIASQAEKANQQTVN